MFGICSYQAKHTENVGTLFRSAYLYGCSSLNTVGRKYSTQSSDTVHSTKHINYYHFESFDNFLNKWKGSLAIVAVELDDNAISIENFIHPYNAIYVLGNESYGIPKKNLDKCDYIVQIPTVHPYSMNVAVAGSIVLADRFHKTLLGDN